METPIIAHDYMVVHRKLGGVGHVVVLGSGNVGMAIGVGLRANGCDVTFVAHDSKDTERFAQAKAGPGVRLWHASGWSRCLNSEQLESSFDPMWRSEVAVRDADVILVSTPREQYSGVAKLLASNHKIGAPRRI